MSSTDVQNPNRRQYAAKFGGKYLSTRLVSHNGITIAFALGRTSDEKSLFFDYSILNLSAEEDPKEKKSGSPDAAEKLDANYWLENAKPLQFPSEVRVAAEEAAPVYEIPRMDRTGRPTKSTDAKKLNLWLSTSLCLTSNNTSNFQVMSDGRYIYLFRQSIAASSSPPNSRMTDPKVGLPPVDSNLLCDRFTLLGDSLSRTLEVRYRRSRQKRLPLNEQDTLAVRDIDDNMFYEPTFSLRFINTLVDGRFTVLQTPTMTNGQSKWMIFTRPSNSGHEIQCFTADVATDGLFDIHGRIYYTCENSEHEKEKVFSTAPGACTAVGKNGETCGKPKTPIIPKSAHVDQTINLRRPGTDIGFSVSTNIILSGDEFSRGFTLEAWVKPNLAPVAGEQASPSGAVREFLFSQPKELGPSVFFDDKLRLALCYGLDGEVLSKSTKQLDMEKWTHVALTYTAETRTYKFIINGIESVTNLYSLPEKSKPGSLSEMGYSDDSVESTFRGQIDEVRLWQCPMHPDTIKARMATRITGMEPLLEAGWHFDEGTGMTVYDCSPNGHDIDIIDVREVDNIEKPGMWVPSTAPLVSHNGLSRTVLRISDSVEGGLGATVYHEQVSVSKEASEKSEKEESDKPMKRSARLLLTFVVSQSGDQKTSLAVLDFAILADGTLSGCPPNMSLPKIKLVELKNTKSPSGRHGPTEVLYVDPQGLELFGGILDFNEAVSERDPPLVWNSATGSISIFFRNKDKLFSAIVYNVTRSLDISAPSALGTHMGILAACKLRKMQKLTISTTPCKRVPKDVAVTLTLKAEMADGSTTQETWNGIPANSEQFCSILSGTASQSPRYVGKVKSVEKTELPTSESGQSVSCYRITLNTSISTSISIGSYITVGTSLLQVVRFARKGETLLIVSPTNDKTESDTSLISDAEVQEIIYDAGKLVECQQGESSDFSRGSNLIAVTSSGVSADTIDNYSDKGKTRLVCAEGISTLLNGSGTPFFSAGSSSSALRLDGKNYFTSTAEAIATTACSGIAFESWIKVSEPRESVIVAYTSEHLPRSEDAAPEKQTFILSTRPQASSSAQYDLNGIINGAPFQIKDAALTEDTWVHVACTANNVFALEFSGSNYVDLGRAAEFNVSDFSLAFTLTLKESNTKGDQIMFAKAEAFNTETPLLVELTRSKKIRLTYWGEKEGKSMPVSIESKESLGVNSPYKVFVSRKLHRLGKKNETPVPIQVVAMTVWDASGMVRCTVDTPTLTELQAKVDGSGIPTDGLKSAQLCDAAKSNEGALTVGGAPWAPNGGLYGIIGPIRLYSSEIPTPSSHEQFCKTDMSEKGLIGSWSFRGAEGFSLADDTGRNNGKLKEEPVWRLSPFEPDHQRNFYLNGIRVKKPLRPESCAALEDLAGAHQFSVGNAIHGNDKFRYLAMRDGFKGEIDELRIWNVPRTYENITDAMNARLTETSMDMAVYLPFDNDETGGNKDASISSPGILGDVTANCLHLTPLYGRKPYEVRSDAPIGRDAPCVFHAMAEPDPTKTKPKAATISAAPSVAEYGDLQIGASGSMEGSYKRAYTFVTDDGKWNLITGFRIGALITEWVSQVQTSPTLMGYIEGAPPIPAENFTDKEDDIDTSISFSKAESCTYTYSANKDQGTSSSLEFSAGVGAKWEVSAGLGVETEVSSGELSASLKTAIDISNSSVNNNVTTTTTNNNIEVSIKLTGSWTKDEKDVEKDVFLPVNIGLALVESEVADVFALRLKTRGPISPLVAYQMRPNPDIPKDRNLVSFHITKTYTKQGCLDGRRGLEKDEDYPRMASAPKSASYFKPGEAYALKDRIRRAEEQLAGEYDRFEIGSLDILKKRDAELPKRTRRNICNSYVWTADGGTFQETHSTMDQVSTEAGGNLEGSIGAGISSEIEASGAMILGKSSTDAMFSTHYNLTLSKSKSSETGFELKAELPPPVDLLEKQPDGKYAKRPGAVDAYRWMSFWLEESTEATDAFFQQVVDPLWLEQSPDPSARLLLSLRASLAEESGNARTKAWRVFHRCTYVSRVPEPIPTSPAAVVAEASAEEKKMSPLLADLACNWRMMQQLEPLVRGAESRTEMARRAQPLLRKLYPRLCEEPRFYGQVLDALAEYLCIQ